MGYWDYKELPYLYEKDKNIYSLGLKGNIKVLDIVGPSNMPKAILAAKENKEIIFVVNPKYYIRKKDNENEYGIEWGQGHYFDSPDVSCEKIREIYKKYGFVYDLDRDIYAGKVCEKSIHEDKYYLSSIDCDSVYYGDELRRIANTKYDTFNDLIDDLVKIGYGKPSCELKSALVCRGYNGFYISENIVMDELNKRYREVEKGFCVSSEYDKEEIIFGSVRFSDVVSRALDGRNDKDITSVDIWKSCEQLISEFSIALREEIEYSMESIVADANKKTERVHSKNI